MDKRMLRTSLGVRGQPWRDPGGARGRDRQAEGLPTDDERGASCLYAWALVKRQERRVLASARKGEHRACAGGG
jgi:hypothetical protein